MNNPRRLFLTKLTAIAGVATLNRPLTAVASITKHINTLDANKNGITIYHTNDLNGQVNSFYKGLGGLSQVKTLLQDQETGGLLVDAGNFINGKNSPAQQKQVITLMNAMGYHAAAVGSNELSLGQAHLASLIPHMQFTMVNCNLQFNNELSSLIKPYIVITSGKYKIGITGVCRQVEGIKYNDAIKSANTTARILKEDKKCDLVICLSHLGHTQEGDIADNQKLARQSENIDMIIGGQNPKLSSDTFVLANKLKHEVILAQTACNGLTIGRSAIGFNNNKHKSGLMSEHFIAGPIGNKKFPFKFSDLQQDKNLYLTV